MIFLIFLAMGAMGANDTLTGVAARRNALFGANLPHTRYECLAGVQTRYSHLIGSELWFYDFTTGGIVGPVLVVDSESPDHAGQMEEKEIALDLSCKNYTHHYGIVFMLSPDAHIGHLHHDGRHLTSIAVTTPIPEMARILSYSEYLCGDGQPLTWRARKHLKGRLVP